MSSGPRIAVVIPAFKQPSLVIEAIESALRQRTTFDYRIVVVNDGCPFTQTEDVCRAYARAHPDKIRYVRRSNGGLSAARNTGIDAALGMWPSIEAIQMLDSDDRIGSYTLQHGYDALARNPDAAWAYPNCKRFAFGGEYTDVTGPWSVLELLTRNYVFCASMVRRAVFDGGLRYDEQMRQGYEDWNFWITAAEAGYHGVHAPEMDFLYRRRAESMLGDTTSNDAPVVAYVRKIHAPLYSPRRVLELEHAEMPRFALVLTDEKRVVLTSDPSRLERDIPLDQLPAQLLRGIVQPERDRFPPYVVITTRAFLNAAQDARIASGLLWTLQNTVERTPTTIAAARVRTCPGLEYRLEVSDGASREAAVAGNAAVAMLTRDLLHQYLAENSNSRRLDPACGDAERPVDFLSYHLLHPRASVDPDVDAVRDLDALIKRMAPDYRQLPRPALARGSFRYRLSSDASAIVRNLFRCGPLYPAILDKSKINAAYIVPVCEFGGAERVTLNFGRESRRRGWTPHLFVISTPAALLLPEFADVFESITVVPSGVTMASDEILGLLATMDVVVNNNSSRIDPLLAPLRRFGVKAFSQIHSVTIPVVGMPTGQPYEVLRYEHSLDGVLVVSKKLGRWCRAWGIPETKIIHVPNAPSFAVSEVTVETTLIERAERSSQQPLNVLFLGRFDREKGMDRLVALCGETAKQSVPIQWRVVGRRVLGGDGHPQVDLTPIQSLIEPPAMTGTALSRLYRWADVVIMLSRFEGVPLTILEAQRFGCVVLATDVGAINELIDNGRTGFLFSNKLETSELVNQMIRCLRGLQADRGKLLEITRATAEVRREETWAKSFEPFARVVESMFAGTLKANS